MNLKLFHNKSQGTIRYEVWVCLILVIITLSAYWQVRHFDFTNFDDNLYVYDNRHIRSGMTPENVVWSFTFQEKDNNYWHPLTWLSHMLDVELYGLDPGRHHLTNVLFHTVNALLLFMALNWMTGAIWRSAFVAILFALHPLNVESVAWVSERKNVLSTFFWMLTLLAYLYYTRRTSFLRYFAVCSSFSLGLLAKPMLVTLPFVLMLLDYWPLRRWCITWLNSSMRRESNSLQIILEKAPLLLLSTLSVYISSKSVQKEGDVISFKLVPLLLRIENALVSYVKYIGKMIWPQDLSVYYPFPELVSAGQLMGAVTVIVGLSALAIWGLKRRPYLAVGWFWFIGALVPVSGVVQVGLWPEMADRWAYVPLIGLFIMIAWGMPEMISGWRHKQKILAVAAGTVLLLLFITTRIQISHWTNSTTLFKQAVKAVGGSSVSQNNLGNAFILNNLALALMDDGRNDEALKNLMVALNLVPDSPRVNYNIGHVLKKQGKNAEAIGYFKQAAKLNPKYFLAHYNLATALMAVGKIDEAISHYQLALDLSPDNKDALNEIGSAMVKQGRITEALSYYSKALDLDPADPEVHNNLGVALIHTGRTQEAVQHFRTALKLNPEFVAAQNNLNQVLAGYR